MTSVKAGRGGDAGAKLAVDFIEDVRIEASGRSQIGNRGVRAPHVQHDHPSVHIDLGTIVDLQCSCVGLRCFRPSLQELAVRAVEQIPRRIESSTPCPIELVEICMSDPGCAIRVERLRGDQLSLDVPQNEIVAKWDDAQLAYAYKGEDDRASAHDQDCQEFGRHRGLGKLKGPVIKCYDRAGRTEMSADTTSDIADRASRSHVMQSPPRVMSISRGAASSSGNCARQITKTATASGHLNTRAKFPSGVAAIVRRRGTHTMTPMAAMKRAYPGNPASAATCRWSLCTSAQFIGHPRVHSFGYRCCNATLYAM